MARGDTNRPDLLTIPWWGPDGNSRRLAHGISQRVPTVSPASYGAGITQLGLRVHGHPGTDGLSTQYLPPQQNFKGAVKYVLQAGGTRNQAGAAPLLPGPVPGVLDTSLLAFGTNTGLGV